MINNKTLYTFKITPIFERYLQPFYESEENKAYSHKIQENISAIRFKIN
jgi:hypothetical protein